MALIPREGLPAMIEKDRDTAVTLDVYSAASVQQTATAATLKLYAGSTLVLEDVAATGLGPPVTYTVQAAETADRTVSADWLFEWSLTISGAVQVFVQPAYLVKTLYRGTITQDDLTALHSDLDSLRDSANMATFEPFITLARERVQRRLIKTGHRPALIFDQWALTDLLTYEALAPLFRDFASSLGDSRYAELSAHYDTKAREEWASIVFRYDENEDGIIGQRETRSGTPAIYLTPPKRWWY